MPKSSVLIQKFLVLVAEIHRREVTQLMVATYQRTLGDVPPEALGPALLETLSSVTHWPTPGDIRRKLNDLESVKAQPAVWKTPEDWTTDGSTKEERIAYAKELRERVGRVADGKAM